MTAAQEAIEILEQLLHAHARSLLSRLREANPYVSWASADDHAVISSCIAKENEHQAALVDAILSLGANPGPVRRDLSSGSAHFLELHTLMPQIIAQKQQLIERYESAAQRLAPESEPSRLVHRVLLAERAQLARCEKLGGHVSGPKQPWGPSETSA